MQEGGINPGMKCKNERGLTPMPEESERVQTLPSGTENHGNRELRTRTLGVGQKQVQVADKSTFQCERHDLDPRKPGKDIGGKDVGTGDNTLFEN